MATSYDALETNHEVVFSEIEDRVSCLQLDKEEKNHEIDVFMEDGDVAPSSISDQETKDGGWSSVKETINLVKEEKKELLPVNYHECWKSRQEEMLASYRRRKREKRRERYPEELKNFDMRKTFASSVIRMREAQAKMGRQGQSTVGKDFAGGLATSDRSEAVLKKKQKTIRYAVTPGRKNEGSSS